MVVSGRLTPFRFETRPATSTTVTARLGSASSTLQHHLAVVDEDAVAGRERAQDLRMGQLNARGVARRRIGVERESVPLVQFGAAVGEQAEPELRPLQVDEHADRPARLLLERADHRDPRAHVVMRGVAHVDAEDVGPAPERATRGPPGSAEAGPRVAMIFTRRLRRECTALLLRKRGQEYF